MVEEVGAKTVPAVSPVDGVLTYTGELGQEHFMGMKRTALK